MERIRAALNKAMGTISMYNGMLFGVASIWAVSLIFSFVGILSFDPLAMVASLAVLAVSTGLSSWLVGALFGVRSHGPSSLITGIILALIFTPTLQAGGLMALAMVGLIAGASKYVFVYKARHVFNPVALAAVVIGLTGLTAASWWVATPPLTVFVLAVVLVSLYKSKQYALVLTFLVVATALLLGYFALNGVSFPFNLALLLSWPLLFFAGIMLTEPLTLPPKKWHRYTEAVIVAILFALPIRIGEFETGPAVALLVGNLFAAIVAGRRAITLTFKQRRRLTPTTDELVFTPDAPVHFEAGQYMELHVPLKKQDLRGERRSFSMTSVPNGKEVTFGVKFYEPSSRFKKAVRSFKAGTKVRVSNLSGDFTVPKDPHQKVVLVAGGIGVTPFISHLKTLALTNDVRDIILLYAVSSAAEVAYIPELKQTGATVIVISPDKPADLPKQWRYVKAHRLNETILNAELPDATERVGYVSGPSTFVQTTKRSLKKLGVSKVKTDYFVGY
jgi:glycine betaine catabolism B